MFVATAPVLLINEGCHITIGKRTSPETYVPWLANYGEFYSDYPLANEVIMKYKVSQPNLITAKHEPSA